MNDATLLNLIRAVCGVLVALPGTLALAPGLVLSPGENAAFLVLALLGATALSQLRPVGDDDVASWTPTRRRRMAEKLKAEMMEQP